MQIQEAKMSETDYQRFQDLILDRTGILISSGRREAVERAIIAGVGSTEREQMGSNYRLLEQETTDSEAWDDLISTITVGETFFFRNDAHFDALRQHILPDLIKRHAADRQLRIWSAGCSTGEEPYSIAILLQEILADVDRWNITILATDIDRQVLRSAPEGRFRKWSFRGVDPAVRRHYFSRPSDQVFELRSQVRGMVTFEYLNLTGNSYPSLTTNTNAMDLILCRNVVMYFHESVARRVISRLHDCMLPGSYLILGAVEGQESTADQFEVCSIPGATVYQRMGETLVPSAECALEPFIHRLPSEASSASHLRQTSKPLSEDIETPAIQLRVQEPSEPESLSGRVRGPRENLSLKSWLYFLRPMRKGLPWWKRGAWRRPWIVS